MTTPPPNAFNKLVGTVQKLPSFMQIWALSKAIGSQVKLVGTAKCRIETLTASNAVVTVKNRNRVQNHIGSVHACAMALIAESATGFVCGMNCPNDSVVVIKSMTINFVKRATGDMRAEAWLTEEQQQLIRNTEKGETSVKVKITDETGIEPIEAEMIWAWVPKKRKPKPELAE